MYRTYFLVGHLANTICEAGNVTTLFFLDHRAFTYFYGCLFELIFCLAFPDLIIDRLFFTAGGRLGF